MISRLHAPAGPLRSCLIWQVLAALARGEIEGSLEQRRGARNGPLGFTPQSHYLNLAGATGAGGTTS